MANTNLPWPYPRWIAHRGAGKLAPENTLAAFRVGAQHGYRMFECDVQVSADDVAFLMHDETLQRTTCALPAPIEAGVTDSAAPAIAPSNEAIHHPWSTLRQLDAGAWHSTRYAAEPLPTLAQIAQFCLREQAWLNIEIKPVTGYEARTGRVVANMAAKLWAQASVPPLLTSFAPASLEAARASAPQLPRGLLLETLPNDWLELAASLGCQAVVCDWILWDQASVAAAKSAGLRCLAYTVNELVQAQKLLALGLDGIITDCVDEFSPSP